MATIWAGRRMEPIKFVSFSKGRPSALSSYNRVEVHNPSAEPRWCACDTPCDCDPPPCKCEWRRQAYVELRRISDACIAEFEKELDEFYKTRDPNRYGPDNNTKHLIRASGSRFDENTRHIPDPKRSCEACGVKSAWDVEAEERAEQHRKFMQEQRDAMSPEDKAELAAMCERNAQSHQQYLAEQQRIKDKTAA
jgi:hypothetical protein